MSATIQDQEMESDMDDELKGLLEKAKGVALSPEELAESHIRMAVANGRISDGRVTVDALRSALILSAISRAVHRCAGAAENP